MSTKKWADLERTARAGNEPELQPIIDALEHLLDGTSSPPEAARLITETLAPALKRNPNSLLINAVMGAVCSAARRLGADAESSERLAALLETIQALPPLAGASGVTIRHGWGGAYWADLPTWALTFREYGIVAERIAIEPDEDLTETEWLAQAPEFHAATVFAATHLARNLRGSGMQFYAEQCLKEALEMHLVAPSTSARAKMYIPAAAAWVRVAGAAMWGLCRENEIEGKGKVGWSGLGVERWEMWKRKFEEVSANERVPDRARKEAGHAVEDMKRAEEEQPEKGEAKKGEEVE